MAQPNTLIWPERFKKHPVKNGETPFQYYRRIAEIYDTTFGNVRGKYHRHFKKAKGREENSREINPTIDGLGVLSQNITQVWTKQGKNGEITHSILHKVDEFEDLDRIVKSLENYKFVLPKAGKPVKGESLGMINIFDAHIDKLSITETTNYQSSLEKNVDHFKQAYAELVEYCLREGVGKIVVPIGNDFFNADNAQNTTYNGTPQHSYFDWINSFIVGRDLLRWCGDLAISHGLPCEFSLVKCNHAPTKSWYLAQTLACIFEKSNLVTVEHQWIKHKFLEFGLNMIGLTHGDAIKENDLQTFMSAVQPEMWGRTKHRYCYVGHWHRGKNTKYKTLEDKPGVEIHFLRSFTGGPDQYHFDNGYIGIPKTAYAHIHHKVEGLTDIKRKIF